MPIPMHATLVADTERVIDLGANYGMVRVVVVDNPAITYFNVSNTPVPAVASNQDGNEVIPATLCAVEAKDRTTGNTIVRLRSAGTPRVAVTAW